MITIEKIVLKNFKRFKSFEMNLNSTQNIIVGDNESGKSTILLAINLALSASRTKVENIGVQNLLNIDIVDLFLGKSKENRTFDQLPGLRVEVFFSECNDYSFRGNGNSNKLYCDGIYLSIIPNEEYRDIINELLESDTPLFPYEYYVIEFKTFANSAYKPYMRKINHMLIDNSSISNEYATREYIRDLYHSTLAYKERNEHQFKYRKLHDEFKDTSFKELSEKKLGENFSFGIASTHKFCLENLLQLFDGKINIENKGKGHQNLLKTKFALSKKAKDELNVVLIEEPENHLSHRNMALLLNIIEKSTDSQLVIATHSNMIASRLGLQNLFLMNSNSECNATLSMLTDETSKFFMKSPNNNILNFILSKRVILVEGHAEYILMGKFLKKPLPEIQIISVNGLSFKRYLEIAKILKIRVAVITDNDGDFNSNCINKYSDFSNDSNIRIFYETDNSKSTFEKTIYSENKNVCDKIFGDRKNGVEAYMLSNKADCAYQLLVSSEEIVTPQYINKALEWIKE